MSSSCCTGTAYTLVQGDSFALAYQQTAEGQPVDMTGWLITASLIDNSGNTDALTVTHYDLSQGTFEISGDTTDWTPGVSEICLVYVTDVGQKITRYPDKVLITRRL